MLEIRTIEPTGLPISLVDAKAHLNITASDDDTYITSLINAAVNYVENYTGRALHAQTFTQYRDSLATKMTLAHHPILDVTTLKYYDSDGNQQTLSSALYRVDAVAGRITPAYGATWPAARAMTNTVEIAYRAGYVDTAASPDTGTIPDGLIHAAKIIMSNFYENREGAVVGKHVANVPHSATSLMDAFRIYAI